MSRESSSESASPDPNSLHRHYEALRLDLSGRELIIAANRGPVTFEENEDGTLRFERSSGGLVTARSWPQWRIFWAEWGWRDV